VSYYRCDHCGQDFREPPVAHVRLTVYPPSLTEGDSCMPSILSIKGRITKDIELPVDLCSPGCLAKFFSGDD